MLKSKGFHLKAFTDKFAYGIFAEDALEQISPAMYILVMLANSMILWKTCPQIITLYISINERVFKNADSRDASFDNISVPELNDLCSIHLNSIPHSCLDFLKKIGFFFSHRAKCRLNVLILLIMSSEVVSHVSHKSGRR